MLIARKMEINYSKRASSMLEFAVIEENGEVACDDEAGHRATVRTGERRLDRYHWNLAGHHRRRNRMYRARLAATFGEAIAPISQYSCLPLFLHSLDGMVRASHRRRFRFSWLSGGSSVTSCSKFACAVTGEILLLMYSM